VKPSGDGQSVQQSRAFDAATVACLGVPSPSEGCHAASARPILLCDVDGVLAPFRSHNGIYVASTNHRGVVPHAMIPRMRALLAHYDLWWATAWEDEANEALAPLFGLEDRPVVRMTWQFSRTWKLGAVHATVDRCASGRAVAWIDDHVGPSGRQWAAGRPNTLALSVPGHTGLDDGHVADLLQFAQRVSGLHARSTLEPSTEGLGLRRAAFLAGRRLRRFTSIRTQKEF
jgi:hypothetical protein